jgi:hypothetical protein
MSAPFYNAIRGTTSGTPGTGAFTPNAASSGFRAWSLVPTGWMGMVRYEDGTAWELSWCYWNGTTLSRGTNQLFDSSTGSVLSLTSAANATMEIDAAEVMPELGGMKLASWLVNQGTAALENIASATITATGTAAAGTFSNASYLNRTNRSQTTSATTANAQAGWSCAAAFMVSSTTAGSGGWSMRTRIAASQLPTGPRLFCGLTSTTFVANTGEPSALTAHVAAFAKDSTDTNIQLLVNSNAGSGTKTDTGIVLATTGWYEFRLWAEPGSTKIYALMMDLNAGTIWYNTTTSDVPGDGALLMPQVLGGLNGSNTGTAIIMHTAGAAFRGGFA